MAMRFLSWKCHFVLCFLFLILCCHCKGKDSSLTTMKKKEKEVIYSVIQVFVGKWWNGSYLYPDPCGWTPIQGVSCEQYDDGFWYVTTVNFGPVFDNSHMCSRDAKFPQQLFNLKHLKVLSLSSCFLSPTKNPVKLPLSNWEKFSHSLESLTLRSNPGLVGTIPSAIGSLRKLQSLVLLENGLIGKLPPSISNLVRLRQLVLARNYLVGEVPANYGGLSELLIFDASRNNLSGVLPSTLGSLDSLLKLDLSNNMLEGKLPKQLGRLKNLTLLDISHNKLRGGLAETLKELAFIKHLVLSNNPLGGDLSGVKWENFLNTETLDLSNIGLEGRVPESMEKMKRLRFLDLSNNYLSGNVSRSLENLTCLGTLHVNGNNLTGRLDFSERFYMKMGMRFAAWNNANLCYIVKSNHQVPYGVKPCVQNITISEGFSTVKITEGNHEDSSVVASLGGSGFYGLWWVFTVNSVLNVFLWNMLS
ncbi:piriformospora indica-insensitive protein 2-like isoform X1 [Vigna radiata var. radiata]|uniref:Piriformospora indica-insensitive protein 2-like isoform X1 n=1 Tax=Vigna radiata var. radiata TaxID=3916 RepID=A0A1S3UKT2_VIGRR|nr:piriformospora indica-insensitive protein 2-like isoform X1 [Vigna radiata var. radiata]